MENLDTPQEEKVDYVALRKTCLHEEVEWAGTMRMSYPPVKYGVCTRCKAIVKNTNGVLEWLE